MFFWNNRRSRVVLHAIDIFIATLCYVIIYFVKENHMGRYSGLSSSTNYFTVLLLYLFYYNFMLSFFHFSIPTIVGSRFRELIKAILIVCLSSVFVIVTLYILHQSEVSRILLGLYVSVLILVLFARRLAVSHYLRVIKSKGKDQIRILVVGSRDRAKETIRTILGAEDDNYEVVGCLEIDAALTGKLVEKNIKILGDMRQFKFILLNQVIDEVIFAIPLKQIENVNDQIAFAEKIGVKIRIMPDWQLQQIMFRPETASIFFENFVGIPTLALSSTPKKDLELLFKSFFDYFAALISIVALSPVFLLIALLVKFTSPGPVLFSQVRSGLNGRKFRVYKFRTMVENAEALKASLNDQNEMDGPVFKIAKDPRITPVGSFLRKTSLDELPQLFNILKGEMSLVGPRPPIPAEVEEYLPCQRRRLSMKPGLTCIWQVSGKRNDISFDDWMKMDLRYIDNWCLLLDIKLLFRTVAVVLAGGGR
ncbi:sugar transferase [Desulfogranum japonicum]|uniref:sugar transferase n=1 Tax=Desulfogranum japonicum TaxID=231447 RepID=UPI00048BEF6E|nr:sugar transferase [Desulfogranum japonicum]